MVDIPIDDVASIGVIRDIPGYELPPEAWTIGRNVRFIDEGVEWAGAKTQLFGTPTVAPHFALPVRNASAAYLIYVSLTKAYVYDGAAHTNITRQSAGVDVNYTGTETRQWNGTLLSGIPILNNGIDAPQYWDVALNTATKLADLSAIGTTRARVIRAFGPYLVAFDVTISGTRYPHAVLWSHPADPGSLPTSWDYTDPTKDAGLNDLPDTFAGIIKDAMQLRGRMVIYKEGSTWVMTPVSGGYIFDFQTLYEASGILAQRCVTPTPKGDHHFVATQDDIVVHDGAQVEPMSLLTKRMKRYLFNQIDSSNYVNSFCFMNPFTQECWFCYPESGQTNPNMAVVWNAVDNVLSEREVNFRNAIVAPTPNGAIVVPTWATATDTWSTGLGGWETGDLTGAVGQRTLIVCNTDATKIQQLDLGDDNDGVAVTATLQRTGLALAGRKRNGDWIVDFHKRKFVHRIRLKLSGGPVNVRVGFQELVDGDVEWSATQSFDPTSQLWIDVAGCGQAVAIEISGATPWRLEGYTPEIELIGDF